MLHVDYVTDPACPWSWGAEPVRWGVEREFGAGVRITCVMGGLAREFGPPDRLVAQWLMSLIVPGCPWIQGSGGRDRRGPRSPRAWR